MIEIRGKIYGLLFCGSHDENVFVFVGAWGLVCMAWCQIHWIFMEISWACYFRNECKIRQNEIKMKGNTVKSGIKLMIFIEIWLTFRFCKLKEHSNLIFECRMSKLKEIVDEIWRNINWRQWKIDGKSVKIKGQSIEKWMIGFELFLTYEATSVQHHSSLKFEWWVSKLSRRSVFLRHLLSVAVFLWDTSRLGQDYSNPSI